jgi:uncharacterized protein (DUF3084 family)
MNLAIALIFLPLMGALIAWAGDVIGYRLGRSRRSLFGLRPRITARLIGVAVGALLPIVGLAVAVALSENARDALLRLGDIKRQTASLSQQIPRLQAEISRAQKEAGTERQRAHDAGQSRLEAEARLRDAWQALSSARSVLDRTRRQLDQTRKLLSTSSADLATSRERLTQTRNQLASAQQQVAAARAEADRARVELGEVRADLTQTQGQLQLTQHTLSSAQAELESADKVRREIAAAQAHLTELSDQLAETGQALARYKIALSAMVGQDVAYEPGEEIIRAIVEADRTLPQLEAILVELLNFASAAAGRHGIATGPNGRTIRALSPIPADASPLRATEEDIIHEVATQIRQGAAPTYVVIVRAWGRAFKSQAEQMTAEFWVAPNRTVFSAGEIILTTEVDGSRPRAHVFRELWQAVSGIRRLAADRGMLPSPVTGRYGEVSAEDLLASLDQVLAIGGPARVRAVVAEDARVAQPEDAPMRVELRVDRIAP